MVSDGERGRVEGREKNKEYNGIFIERKKWWWT
jgi:hypothetical protein